MITQDYKSYNLAMKEYRKIFEPFDLQPHQVILVNNAWHNATENASDIARAAWALVDRTKSNLCKIAKKAGVN